MIKNVPFKLPSSRLTTATAAAQGVYSSVNTKKLNALNGENNVCRVSPSSVALAPVSTANVLITASFAMKPVINPVETRQSEKPMGVNITLTACPIAASMLSALSAT